MQCLLTPCMRPRRVQLALLLPERASGAVAAALDALERALGAGAIGRIFGLLLTDNGSELSDAGAVERSATGEDLRRKAYYRDVRSSNQKECSRTQRRGAQENPAQGAQHRLRRAGPRDCAVLMPHLNSEPRPSLMGMSPFRMMRAADPGAAKAVMGALRLREVAPTSST